MTESLEPKLAVLNNRFLVYLNIYRSNNFKEAIHCLFTYFHSCIIIHFTFDEAFVMISLFCFNKLEAICVLTLLEVTYVHWSRNTLMNWP